MYRVLIFLITILSSHNFLSAQEMEKELLKALCKNIADDNKYFLLHKEFRGIFMVEDPVSGMQKIVFPDSLNEKITSRFRKYSDSIQVRILSVDSLPIFPLQKTTYLIDTLGVFTPDLIIDIDTYLFKITNDLEVGKTGNYFYLSGVYFRGDDLVLYFKFANSKFGQVYYFNLKSGQFNVVKKRSTG